MKAKGTTKWELAGFRELAGFSSLADYLDAKLNERGITFEKPENNKRGLVCIGNINTNEVLRIPHFQAQSEFLSKSNTPWGYVSKEIYKKYIKSRRPGNENTGPVFIQRIEDLDGKPQIIAKYICDGYPSNRVSKKRSSCNKKGKHRYQRIAENTVWNKDNEEEVKEARTIKHLKDK
jgi:hypothetical protein